MKLASLRLDTACWLSIILETFFYGVYTIIFVAGASIFFNPSTRGRIPLLIAVPSLLLYLNASAHVVTTVVHGANGFIRIASQGQVDGAINYFATTVNGVNIANHCLYVLNNFLGDSILIWRCYIVWARNWKVIVVPLCLLCTSVVSGFVTAYQFSHTTHGPFSSELGPAANMFFTSLFLTNILVTSLTAFKIWRCRKMLLHIPTTTTSSRSQAANGSNTTVNAPRRANVAFNEIDGERRRVAEYTGAFNIVVESGAIYSIILAMELMLYSLGQNFIFVLYTSMAQITGIAPTGIIVLVLLGRTLRHSNRSVSAPSSHRHQQSITNISFAPTGSGHARGARNFKFFGSRRPGSSGRGRDGADNDVISLDLDITHRNRRAVDEENSPGSAAINGSYSPDVKRSSGYDETCESSTPFGSAIAVAVSDGDRDRKPSFSKTRGGAAPTKIEIDVRTEQQVLESRVGGRGGYTYPETPNLDVDSTQRTWETHSPPRSPPQSRNPYAQPPSSQPLVNAQTHAPQSPTRVHTPQYHRPNLQARRTTSAQESPSFETNQGATRGEEESGGYGGTVVDRNPYLSPHGGDWRPVDGNTDWRPVGNGQDDWRHAGA